MITINDKRPEPPDNTIPAEDAEGGKLYETTNGLIVLAVCVPATDYQMAFGRTVLFVQPNGKGYPQVSDRLTPLDGTVEWTLTGKPDTPAPILLRCYEIDGDAISAMFTVGAIYQAYPASDNCIDIIDDFGKPQVTTAHDLQVRASYSGHSPDRFAHFERTGS